MYYLNPKKNADGGYSNFQSTPFRGAIELTEEQAAKIAKWRQWSYLLTMAL